MLAQIERSELISLAQNVAVDFHNVIIGKTGDERKINEVIALYNWLNGWLITEHIGIFAYQTQILFGVWKDRFEGRSINGDEAIAEMKEEVVKITNILWSRRATLSEMEFVKIFCVKLLKSLLIES